MRCNKLSWNRQLILWLRVSILLLHGFIVDEDIERLVICVQWCTIGSSWLVALVYIYHISWFYMIQSHATVPCTCRTVLTCMATGITINDIDYWESKLQAILWSIFNTIVSFETPLRKLKRLQDLTIFVWLCCCVLMRRFSMFNNRGVTEVIHQ